jgi:hypothetical protein
MENNEKPIKLGTEKTFFNPVTKKWETKVLIRKNNSLVWKIKRTFNN